MVKLTFHYKNSKNKLFRFFTSLEQMYNFIKKEEIEVEQVDELY